MSAYNTLPSPPQIRHNGHRFVRISTWGVFTILDLFKIAQCSKNHRKSRVPTCTCLRVLDAGMSAHGVVKIGPPQLNPPQIEQNRLAPIASARFARPKLGLGFAAPGSLSNCSNKHARSCFSAASNWHSKAAKSLTPSAASWLKHSKVWEK